MRVIHHWQKQPWHFCVGVRVFVLGDRTSEGLTSFSIYPSLFPFQYSDLGQVFCASEGSLVCVTSFSFFFFWTGGLMWCK